MISRNFIFVNQVTGPLFIDMINVFVEKGHSVTLYTGSIEKTYADLDGRVKVRKFISYNRSSIPKRLMTWGIFFLQAFACMLSDATRDTRFLFVSNPPAGPFLGFFTRSAFDILIYDIYPDILSTASSIRSSDRIYRFFAALNRRIYRKAGRIFTISEGMKEVLSDYADRDKIEVINCWVNTDYIKPIPGSENKFIEKFKLNGKFIVMYSGNLGLAHDIESLLEAARGMKADSTVQFVIIGEGAKKKKVISFVSENDLNNVLILPFQDEKMLPHSMSAADVSVITLESGGASYAVPSKTYYFLAAGAALIAIADSGSELARIVKKHQAGYVIPPKNPELLANKIHSVMDNKELMEKMKKNARTAAGSYTMENAIHFYKKIIERDRK